MLLRRWEGFGSDTTVLCMIDMAGQGCLVDLGAELCSWRRSIYLVINRYGQRDVSMRERNLTFTEARCFPFINCSARLALKRHYSSYNELFS